MCTECAELVPEVPRPPLYSQAPCVEGKLSHMPEGTRPQQPRWPHRARVRDSCPLFPVLTTGMAVSPGASRCQTPESWQWWFGHASGLVGSEASLQDGPGTAAGLSWLVALLWLRVLPRPVAPYVQVESGAPGGGLGTSADFCPVLDAVTEGFPGVATQGLRFTRVCHAYSQTHGL